jgi:hypothetical protein
MRGQLIFSPRFYFEFRTDVPQENIGLQKDPTEQAQKHLQMRWTRIDAECQDLLGDETPQPRSRRAVSAARSRDWVSSVRAIMRGPAGGGVAPCVHMHLSMPPCHHCSRAVTPFCVRNMLNGQDLHKCGRIGRITDIPPFRLHGEDPRRQKPKLVSWPSRAHPFCLKRV